VTDTIDRRSFLKGLAVAGLAVTWPKLASGTPDGKAGTAPLTMTGSGPKDKPGLAIARGSDDPIKLVTAAVDNLGGMKRFVSKGDVVVVKPNIGWGRTPEQAGNTNPQVVEAVVRMCFEAGAKKVKVFDRPCNPAPRTYEMSGIEAAASQAGAEVNYVDDRKFKETAIPRGDAVKSWKIYSEALDADVLINVPILKHHGIARVTMGMKNHMGLLGGNRGIIHINLDRKLADISTVIRPRLTILDAVRVLKAHGPNSGNPDDVELIKHVIAGTDPIAVDSYGARLFGEVIGTRLEGRDVGYIRIGHEMGLGEIDLDKVPQQHIDVA
jgi:uncharacterized protein (DUF362 family)